MPVIVESLKEIKKIYDPSGNVSLISEPWFSRNLPFLGASKVMSKVEEKVLAVRFRGFLGWVGRKILSTTNHLLCLDTSSVSTNPAPFHKIPKC